MIAFSPHVAQFWARLPPSTQYLQVSFMFEISPRRINHGTHHLARGAEHSGVSGIRKQTFREPYEYVGWQFTQGMLTFHHPSFVSNFHQLTALAKVTRRRKFVFYSSRSDGRVTGLELRGKGLGGSLPHLEGLTSLQEVWLGDNDLSGPIPENLFEGLTSLQVVSLYNNELSESIPEKLFEGLTSLQEVHLTGNQLSGSIPQKLFEGLTSLQVVSLFHNRLLGSIPEKLFEGLTSLQVV